MLSAIIPTRGRLDLLHDCLRSLIEQDIDPSAFEVVVIDDGSECDLSPAVASLPPSPISIRLIRQEPSGLTAGRNHGASIANGSILAYLDDDTIVSPGWAAAVISAFEETGCDGMAGRVELQFEAPRPRWIEAARLRLYLSELELGAGRVPLEPPWLPVGANCAVTRAAFDRLGGFRDGFDRVGGSLLSNGDLEFFARLRDGGGTIVYEPGAHVLHRVPAERLTLAWFRRRSYAQGLSDMLFDPPPEGQARIVTIGREIARAGRAAPILVSNLLEGHGPTNARLWLTYCRGRLDAVRSRLEGPNSTG